MKQTRKVLVVEDDRDVRHALEIRLSRLGYDVLQAADGASALAAIASDRPEAVLLDLGLSGDDGYTILDRMRGQHDTRDIPVIVLSGRDEFTHGSRCRDAGAAAFLEKPIDVERLADLLAQLVPEVEAPVEAIEAHPVSSPTADEAGGPLSVMARRVFEGRKILIVDDDEHLRKALVVRLASVGFETVTAADGLSAVQSCREHRPDIVLLDLGLPCGDGFKVIDRIRELDGASQTPIVVLTGRDSSDDVQRCLSAGAQEYLTKPVRNEELLVSLAEALPRPQP